MQHCFWDGDVYCLQETQIKHIFNIYSGAIKYKLISLETETKYYGNDFIINTKLKNNIYRYWKGKDRISDLQFQTN